MQELVSEQFDRVRPVFDPIEHSRPCVFSVIEGNTPGQIFVDRADTPSTAVLRFAGGELYLGGRADDEHVNRQVTDLFHAFGPGLLIYPLSAAWSRALGALLKGCDVVRLIRETFVLDPDLFQERHTHWRSRVPEGLRVQRMDGALALQSDPVLDFLWGGIDRFIARAFGYCVLAGDQVVSRCSPVALGDKRFETGVGTVEAYRRRGLATLACCAFIEHCLAVGLAPEWGCIDEEPSKALALKLGFVSAAQVEAYLVTLPK
jgi:hypothetical protein